MRIWIVLAGLMGASGVALGAWTAHGLDAAAAGWGRLAVQYQMWHAVALLAVAWLAGREGWGGRLANLAGALFLLGAALFCGSLYGLALAGAPLFPMAMPAGGLMLIAGWLALAAAGAVR